MKKNVGLLITVIFCNTFLSVSAQDIRNPVLDMNFADRAITAVVIKPVML